MKKIVRVNNTMQKGYSYELVEPMGKNFASNFRPDLSPKQLLALGIFGGVYMRDCVREYPEEWFTRAKFAPKQVRTHVSELNYFQINASQPLSVWRAKGWIHAHDPRGWFEWYCRYYMGRRIPEEDARQIKRWNAMRRHVGQIIAHCRRGDLACRRRQRQALLHWAYDSRKI